MRIALVNKFLFENGGQESVLLEEARLLADHGHSIALWGMQHANNLPNLSYSETFAPFVDFSSPDRPSGIAEKLKLARQFIWSDQAALGFERFLAEFKPDIIHGHGIAHQLTTSILAVASRYRVPVVQTLHDYQLACPSYTLLQGDGQVCDTMECQQGRGFIPCVQHTCIKGSKVASVLNAVEMTANAPRYRRDIARFICPSKFMLARMQQAGIASRQLSYVANCVVPPVPPQPDGTWLRPADLPERYVVYVGRISHEKGIETLIHAVMQSSEMHLVIIGKGAEAERLKALAANCHRIHWLGFRPRSEVMGYLAHADAMVLPSEWYENAPMSVIEANLLNTPVVASRMGGLPEMVADDSGWLFEAKQVASLYNVLNIIWHDPAAARRKGQTAYTIASQRYAPSIHVQELLAVYQSVLH